MEGSSPASRRQDLAKHLRNTAELARGFAETAHSEDTAFAQGAWWAGVLHDLGKYSDAFQEMLRAAADSRHQRVEHSGQGAVVALQAKALDVAFATAGHHAGLPAPRGGRGGLKERTDRLRSQVGELLRRAKADNGSPLLAETCLPAIGRVDDRIAFDLRIRMLFSCLVDADRLDSAGAGAEQWVLRDADRRLDRLLDYARTRAAQTPEGKVKAARAEVLRACLAKAEAPHRLLSLTVPTGGGKTLAAMAFALRRIAARPAEYRRVIVVIPYLSIIEQNSAVYAEALGSDGILEHHSGHLVGEEVGLECEGHDASWQALGEENWNAPIVVTTSVRFFEGIFSNRPGDLRRLHSVARSVVILDEVQTLPRRYVGPLLSVVGGLANDWGVTFLFCTATQPAFERPPEKRDDWRWSPGTLTEIMPEPARLYQDLRRVTVSWPGECGRPLRWTWDELAEAIARESRVLAIVNRKDHAVALHGILKERLAKHVDRLWHLSARMCPQHRLEVLRQIRDTLGSEDGPCRVVSTQLVEAGVDLDFPVVFRAMAPLDAIAQAAGRCDREGRETTRLGCPAGRVIVFEPDVPSDKALPRGEYEEATPITRAMAEAGDLSVDNPAHVRGFFSRYYGGADLDPRNLQALRSQLDFPAVWEQFDLIDADTRAVLVPYDAKAQQLIGRLTCAGGESMGLLRQLQRYQVGLRPWEFAQAQDVHAIYEIAKGSGVWVCGNNFYCGETGFHLGDGQAIFA